MGIESANYTVISSTTPEEMDFTLDAVATRVLQVSPGVFPKWVKKDEQHWIDIMRGNFGPERRVAVSVRVALCNPPEAEVELRSLLGTLLDELGGSLCDEQTGRIYAGLDEPSWIEVRGGLRAKQNEFRKLFGSFEAAISGDAVFSALREDGGT